MEELAMKLAELLEISTEAATELYPVLRSQFLVYTVYQTVGMFLGLGLIGLLGASIISPMIIDMYVMEQDRERYLVKKLFKIYLVIAAVLFVIYILALIATLLFAPDILFIKGLL